MHGTNSESFEWVLQSTGESSAVRLREAPGAREAVERTVSQAAALRDAAPEPSVFARHLGAQIRPRPMPRRRRRRGPSSDAVEG